MFRRSLVCLIYYIPISIAVTWVILIGREVTSSRSLDRVALHIAAGDVYSSSVMSAALKGFRPSSSFLCDPLTLRSSIIVSLRLAELSLTGGELDKIDESLGRVSASSRESLACSPGEALAWLSLFWAETLSGSEIRENLSFLEQSYHLAPYEVWLALRRAFVALAIFDALPPGVRRLAVLDYATALEGGAWGEAANLIAGAGPSAQRELRLTISEQRDPVRALIANRLKEIGSDIDTSEMSSQKAARVARPDESRSSDR